MGEWIAMAAKTIAGWIVGAGGGVYTAGTMATYNAIAWATKAIIVGVPLLMAGKAMMPKMDAGSLLARGTMQRNPIQSRKIVYGRARVGGTILYMAEGQSGDASKREHLYFVNALAQGECEEIETLYANNDELTLTVRSGYPTVYDVTSPTRYVVDGAWRFTFYGQDMLGTTTQSLNSVFTTYTDLTSDDKFKGICCLQFVLAYDPEAFPSGIPNVSALVKGRKLYDFRDASTAWSDNPALVIYDYLTNTEYGLGVSSSRIDTTSFTTAADLCEEQVALNTDPVTYTNRYTCNGVVDTAASIMNNLEMLLSSLGGNLTYVDGKYKLFGAEYRSPTQTIQEIDLRGDLQLITKPSRREQFNEVKGVYVGEQSQYTPTDYPPVSDSAAITAIGETITTELPLPFTNTTEMCQRIAKIYLKKSLQSYTMVLPLKLTKFALEPNDTVNVTLEKQLGFKSKIFEVVDWQFGTSRGEGGDQIVGVDVTLHETSSDVYDWSSSEETEVVAVAAPTITKINDVAIPSFALTATQETANDGTVVDQIEVNITDPTDDRHITEYDIYWKENSQSNYETQSVLRDSN